METQVFNIESYKVASVSSLKNLKMFEGDPLDLYYYREKRFKNDKEQLHFTEGKAIEEALLRPDSFGKKFKVLGKMPDPDTGKYRFCFAYMILKARGMDSAYCLKVAKRWSGIRNKPETLRGYLEEGGEFWKLIEMIYNSYAYTVISQETYDMAFDCAEISWKNEDFQEFMNDDVLINQKIEWTNQESGQECQGEYDIYNLSRGVMDIKGVADISIGKFLKPRWGTLFKFDYDAQVAAYLEGTHTIDALSDQFGGWIFAIQKTLPRKTLMIRLSEDHIRTGLEKFSRWCLHFKNIRENNLWHMGQEYWERYKLEWDGEIRKVVGSPWTPGIVNSDILDYVYD